MVWLFAVGVLTLLVYSRGFRKITVWLLGLAIIVAIGYWGWLRYTERPRAVDQIAGIKLGMSPIDVKLAKGAPSNDATAQIQSSGEYSLDWSFSTTYGPKLTVLFYGTNPQSLRASIICEADGDTRLFGLGNYSSEEAVTGTLGLPSRTSIAESGLSKIISYSAYNVAFEIEKGDVREVCVTDAGSVGYERELKDLSAHSVRPQS